MKTANELALEYYEKTPMERLHTTLQDYVYDYQKEKIDEMKKQLSDMQRNLQSVSNDEIRPRHYEYDRGWLDCSITVLRDLEELLK